MKKNRIQGHTVKIILILFISAFIFAAFPYTSFAADDTFQIIGTADCGLIVDPPDRPLFEVDNMNPGNRKNKHITVKNLGKDPFTLYTGIERQSGTIDGGDLLPQLLLTVSYGNDTIYHGRMSEFPYTNLGSIPVAGEKDFHFSVYLPGTETGNIFQGSTLTVKFIFYKECRPPDDDPPEYEIEISPYIEIPPYTEIPPYIEIPPEYNIEILPELPKTGESTPPLLFYGTGTSMILIGIILRKKRRAKEREQEIGRLKK